MSDHIRRDCSCPRSSHRHGTMGAYRRDHCRCLSCRVAQSRYREAWLANADRREFSGRLSAVGAARRIQALTANGWAPIAIAAQLGTSENQVLRWRRADVHTWITKSMHDRVARGYNQIWNQPSPSLHAEKMRRMARRNGWPPPLAWDDDTIDSAAAVPHTNDLRQIDYIKFPANDADSLDEIAIERAMRGDRVPLTSPETTEAIRRLAAMRMTDSEIGERLHMTTTAVCQRRLRAGIESRVAVAAKWRAVA